MKKRKYIFEHTDDYGNPLPLDPTYFNLTIAQGTIVYNGNKTNFVGTDLGYKL